MGNPDNAGDRYYQEQIDRLPEGFLDVFNLIDQDIDLQGIHEDSTRTNLSILNVHASLPALTTSKNKTKYFQARR